MRTSEFLAYNVAIGRLLDGLIAPDFGTRLVDLLASQIDFDDCLILVFYTSAPPRIVHVTPSQAAGEDYISGPYLLDPFYDAFKQGRRGCFRLMDLAPDQERLTEDFLAHYRRYDIGDEIGLILSLGEGVAGHISVSRRRKHRGFSRRDVARLGAIAPVLEQALRQHEAGNRTDPGAEAERVHDRLRRALENFGRSVLTEREMEVTRWLLRGYPAKAIARELSISPGTVRNHLKSIYPKLGVTSHAELFALFFSSLQNNELSVEKDPLADLS